MVMCTSLVELSVPRADVVTLWIVWSHASPGFDWAVAVVASNNAGIAQRGNLTAPLLP
jgi:hypothetical protein